MIKPGSIIAYRTPLKVEIGCVHSILDFNSCFVLVHNCYASGLITTGGQKAVLAESLDYSHLAAIELNTHDLTIAASFQQGQHLVLIV